MEVVKLAWTLGPRFQYSDYRKVVAGILSVLLLLCPVSSASPMVRPRRSLEQPLADAVVRPRRSLQSLEQPFADALRAPCSDSTDFRNTLTTYSPRFINDILKLVKNTADLAKNQANTILQNALASCSSSEATPLVLLPTAEELKGMNSSKALERAYGLLVVHAANMYYLQDQEDMYSLSCSYHRPNSNNLSREFSGLRRFLQVTMCYTLTAAEVLRIPADFQESSRLGLETELKDLPECSQRIARDCQVVKSTRDFIRSFVDFIDSLFVEETNEEP